MTETKIFGEFLLRLAGNGVWEVYVFGNSLAPVCSVEIMPVKGVVEDPYDFGNAKKGYRVTAEDFPRVGKLNQIVKGSDLHNYLISVKIARDRM